MVRAPSLARRRGALAVSVGKVLPLVGSSLGV